MNSQIGSQINNDFQLSESDDVNSIKAQGREIQHTNIIFLLSGCLLLISNLVGIALLN